jgi:hypothetical protein
MTTNSIPSIRDRALLVWLTISTWTARKYDRKVSEKVNNDYHASADAGRYNKFLLPGDAASYKALITIAGSIRQQHYADTLAWSDEGWRCLPTANYMQYTETYRKRKAEFDAALDEFVRDYPALKATAKAKLNGLYKEEDYPSAQDIRQRFNLAVEFAPIPAEGDIRVDLSAAQIASIEASIASRIDSAVSLATGDAWSRLHTVVSKINERLQDPDAIFRDSLVENANDVCDVLKRLNVTNDPDLESMRVRVMRELTRYSPDALRTNASQRSTVAAAADKILRDMSAFYAA